MHPPTPSTEQPFDPARYEILRELGTGGAGTVYLVLDGESGEQLADAEVRELCHQRLIQNWNLATMQAACATGDYDSALDRLAENRPGYLRAPIHGTAYMACVAHFAHARLLLNQHLAAGGKGDAARGLLRPDLRALGVLDPVEELRGFYPELFVAGLVPRVSAKA